MQTLGNIVVNKGTISKEFRLLIKTFEAVTSVISLLWHFPKLSECFWLCKLLVYVHCKRGSTYLRHICATSRQQGYGLPHTEYAARTYFLHRGLRLENRCLSVSYSCCLATNCCCEFCLWIRYLSLQLVFVNRFDSCWDFCPEHSVSLIFCNTVTSGSNSLSRNY